VFWQNRRKLWVWQEKGDGLPMWKICLWIFLKDILNQINWKAAFLDVNTPWISPKSQHFFATLLFMSISLSFIYFSIFLLCSETFNDPTEIPLMAQLVWIKHLVHSPALQALLSPSVLQTWFQLASLSKPLHSITPSPPLFTPSYSLPTPWPGLQVNKNQSKAGKTSQTTFKDSHFIFKDIKNL